MMKIQVASLIVAASAAVAGAAAGAAAGGTLPVPDHHHHKKHHHDGPPHSSRDHGGCTPNDPSFDYELLVLQWPPAFGVANPSADPDAFTLHGMWPSRSGDRSRRSTYPCGCTKDGFQAQALAPIEQELDMYWPSLWGLDNDHFWMHEWTKHGTCTHDTELHYFEEVLQFRKKFAVIAALKEAGLDPYGSATPVEQVKAVLTAKFGGTVLVKCHKQGDAGLPVGLREAASVTEVHFCLDKQGVPQDCSTLEGLGPDCKVKTVFFKHDEQAETETETKAVAVAESESENVETLQTLTAKAVEVIV